jgi:hypothetical protein
VLLNFLILYLLFVTLILSFRSRITIVVTIKTQSYYNVLRLP